MEWTNPEIVRERGEPERVALNAKTPRYLSSTWREIVRYRGVQKQALCL